VHADTEPSFRLRKAYSVMGFFERRGFVAVHADTEPSFRLRKANFAMGFFFVLLVADFNVE
jgi:hypothetical protein